MAFHRVRVSGSLCRVLLVFFEESWYEGSECSLWVRPVLEVKDDASLDERGEEDMLVESW